MGTDKNSMIQIPLSILLIDSHGVLTNTITKQHIKDICANSLHVVRSNVCACWSFALIRVGHYWEKEPYHTDTVTTV